MQPSEARRAVTAAIATAAAHGLTVDGAVVLSDSNRLVVRVTPCDVIVRVAVASPAYRVRLAREVEVVRRLAAHDSPVAGLEPRVEPRVFDRDGFAITMWTYVEPRGQMLAPVDYAHALGRLHAGLRQTAVPTPHYTDRIAGVQRDVASRAATPDLATRDRRLLADTLRDLSGSIADRRAVEQPLHGEPHPGNVLDTRSGALFIDFENVAHGPVELDLAWVPREVSERHPDADQDLVEECRGVVLAIIAMHRWRHDDHHPSGRRSGVAFLDALRDGPPWPSIEAVEW